MTRTMVAMSMCLALALLAMPAMAQVVFTFDTDDMGFTIGGTAGAMTLSWDNGSLKLTGGDGDTFDPQVVAPSDNPQFPFAGDDHKEFAIKYSASNLDTDYTCGVFTFSSAGHARQQIPYINGADQVYRLNFSTGDPDGVSPVNLANFEGQDINFFRLDFPEEDPGWADGDTVLLIDWIAWSNDPSFVPTQGGGEGEGEGEGEPTWDNWPVSKVTTPPTIDGVVNPSEYGSAVLTMDPATMAANGGSGTGSGFSAEMACDYYFAWDATALYIGCVVTDDQINNLKNQGDPLNATDIMQIAFDHANAGASATTSDGLTIHDVAPGQANDPNTPAYFEHWGGGAGMTFDNVEYASDTSNAPNWSVELKIPWSDFNPAPTAQIGMQLGYLALLMDFDDDSLNELWWNGGDGTNIIGGPGDVYNKMTLMDTETPPTVPPVVFRFDCDTEGFGETHNVSLDSPIGWLAVTPTGADPYTQVGVNIAGNTLTEFGSVIVVQNAPDANPIQCAMYWFADGGHGRAQFTVQDGVNVVRFNVPDTQDAGAASWDDSVVAFRLDLPETDPTPLINAGTTFLIDAIAFSEFNDFVPDPWTLNNDCDNDGLSNDYEEILGTDPKLADTDGDGVSDGIEVQFGSDPLDPQDTVTVPVMNYLGLGLTALLLAAAALVLVSRRRSTSH